MTRINSQHKGKAGEQEVATMLRKAWQRYSRCTDEEAFDAVRRDTTQAGHGGSDIINPFGVLVEVKRHNRISDSDIERALQQLKCVGDDESIRVIFHRADLGKWKMSFEMPGFDLVLTINTKSKWENVLIALHHICALHNKPLRGLRE